MCVCPPPFLLFAFPCLCLNVPCACLTLRRLLCYDSFDPTVKALGTDSRLSVGAEAKLPARQ